MSLQWNEDRHRWLIGLQDTTVTPGPVWLYFVIDDAPDAAQAARAAFRRAEAEGGAHAKGTAGTCCCVVQQLLCDPLGRVVLAPPTSELVPNCRA